MAAYSPKGPLKSPPKPSNMHQKGQVATPNPKGSGKQSPLRPAAPKGPGC